MNARYLIFGSLAAMLLLVGALLLAGGGEDEGATDGATESPGSIVPGPGGAGTPADSLATDSLATDSLSAPDTTGAEAGLQEPVSGPAGGDEAIRGEAPGGVSAGGSGGSEGRGGARQSATLTSSSGTGSASPAQDPDVSAILRATSRRYEGVRSLQADFQQVINNPLLGRTTRSAGTLYQRQPDLFLMQFSDPDGDVVVSDGDYFWIYYPSVDPKQVMRSARGAQGLDLRSQFIGDPTQRFETEYHGREDVRGRMAHVLTLVPREPLGYRALKVWIDAEDHLVRRFELTEENSNVRRFELTDVRVNPTLPDRLFQFDPPAGAHVVTR